jgi:hypothetical protein
LPWLLVVPDEGMSVLMAYTMALMPRVSQNILLSVIRALSSGDPRLFEPVGRACRFRIFQKRD